MDLLIALRDLFLTALVLPFLAPLWFLPWRAACRAGRWYGRVAFLVWGEGRRCGMINLRRAYPQMSSAEARRSVRAVFENMAQSIVESMQFVRRYRRGDGWQSLYRVEDPALAARILADPRPKIFVTAHLGSWEVAIQILQRLLGGGAGIARRVDNRWLDALVKRLRLDHPSQWIEKRGGASEALKRLKQGESIAMLLDENGGPRGPFVPFFGRPASTRKTPAVLARATGCPIIVGALVRDEASPSPHFLYRLALIEPDDDDIPATTARITAVFESWIRDTPLQWRWIHWRWRTRPDGSSERYGRAEVREAFGA